MAAIRLTDNNDIFSDTDASHRIDALFGDDRVNGNGGNDILNGGFGNDLLHGGLGDDKVQGGDYDDRVFGDAGDDTVSGGAGFDRVVGGEGADTFFGNVGNDVLDLRETVAADDVVNFRVDPTSLAGRDAVYGFGAGDSVDLGDFGGVADLDTDGNGIVDGDDDFSDLAASGTRLVLHVDEAFGLDDFNQDLTFVGVTQLPEDAFIA